MAGGRVGRAGGGTGRAIPNRRTSAKTAACISGIEVSHTNVARCVWKMTEVYIFASHCKCGRISASRFCVVAPRRPITGARSSDRRLLCRLRDFAEPIASRLSRHASSSLMLSPGDSREISIADTIARNGRTGSRPRDLWKSHSYPGDAFFNWTVCARNLSSWKSRNELANERHENPSDAGGWHERYSDSESDTRLNFFQMWAPSARARARHK